MSRWTAFMLLQAVAVWSGLPAQIQDETSNYRRPRSTNWLNTNSTELDCTLFRRSRVSGTWVASAGTFNSTSTTTAIATIDAYHPKSAASEHLAEICAGKFWYRARMLNQRSGSSTRVGIVYQYQDPGNFYEVSFSPLARSSSAT